MVDRGENGLPLAWEREKFPDPCELFAPILWWRVTLKSGTVLRLLADAYSTDGDDYVFEVLVKRTPPPHVPLPTLVVPVADVAEITTAPEE